MNMLRNKIMANEKPVVLYELIPPSGNVDDISRQAYMECAVELTKSTCIPVDAFNLPEIRSEHRNGKRPSKFIQKHDPRQFAYQLKSEISSEIDVVVNHCTVYEDIKTQEKWLEATCDTYGIENIILVGGESHKIRYPGPSVQQMAKLIQDRGHSGIFFGGITIPTRRQTITSNDEPTRMLNKTNAGINFFTSQVLYDADNMKRLLKDYNEICINDDVLPKRIFLSFAPVSSRKDIEFLNWLGVEITDSIEKSLLRSEIGVGWRSIQIIKDVLCEILDFIEKFHIKVPIGLNIEHITQHNFELTKEFIDQLGMMYYQHMSIKENKCDNS